MDFLELLKSQKIDLFHIFKTYKLRELQASLNEIISNADGYTELKNNPVAYNNFFTVLSQIFLIEQNRQQNKVSADATSKLSIVLDKKFKERIKDLADESPTANLP